jgi:hypothetical protein
MSAPGIAARQTVIAEKAARLGYLPAIVLLFAAAVGTSIASAGSPSLAISALVAVTVVVVVAIRPSIAAYAWLAVCPLIVGVARGGDFSVLRPNEVLLLVLLVGVGCNGLRCLLLRQGSLPRLNATDLSIGSLALCGSILPLSLRYGRGLPLTLDDILYATVFLKYLALYTLFRTCVRSAAQVELCLRLIVFASSIVAIIALLQVKDLFSVPAFLTRYYDSPFEGLSGVTTLRGSSTIASSFGLADSMAICLGLSVAWLSIEGRLRPTIMGAALLFLAGCVAAGSVSGMIGCVVVLVVVGLVTGRFKLMAAFGLPGVAITGLVFWPVIAARLAGFDNRNALPKGWIGRIENLETFFWPELFSGFNWLWGVRPAARVPAPETWRDWVYIESGHTWLLWTGGVPLLLCFFLFIWIVAKQAFQASQSDHQPVAIVGAGTLGAAALIFVLMLFDPHLTVRGTADLFFPLAALASLRLPSISEKEQPRSLHSQ